MHRLAIVLVGALVVVGCNNGRRGGGGSDLGTGGNDAGDLGTAPDAGPHDGSVGVDMPSGFDLGPPGKDLGTPDFDLGTGLCVASDCTTCTGMSTCGWCSDTGGCHDGTASGPADGTSCTTTGWAWVTTACPVAGAVP